MTCRECQKDIGYLEHKNSMEKFGVELCSHHANLMSDIISSNNTPIEAIQLFYALKEAGASPMLEWWDGNKSVDIAFSRVKLNIEVETEYNSITHDEAIQQLNEAMHSFKKGFTTLRIPHFLIKFYLKETVDNILGIIEGLKANLKLVN